MTDSYSIVCQNMLLSSIVKISGMAVHFPEAANGVCLSTELPLIRMKIRFLQRLCGAALMESQKESTGKVQLPWRHT